MLCLRYKPNSGDSGQVTVTGPGAAPSMLSLKQEGLDPRTDPSPVSWVPSKHRPSGTPGGQLALGNACPSAEEAVRITSGERNIHWN